jgi:hypothetical protein
LILYRRMMTMPDAVVQGATLVCTCGSTPSQLVVSSQETVKIDNKLAATVADHNPVVNVAPFGVCQKGGPCVPAFAAPWAPGSTSTVKIEGQLALLSTDKLACTAFPGVVTIQDPAQKKTHDT